jgi:hypothetical protein
VKDLGAASFSETASTTRAPFVGRDGRPDSGEWEVLQQDSRGVERSVDSPPSVSLEGEFGAIARRSTNADGQGRNGQRTEHVQPGLPG